VKIKPNTKADEVQWVGMASDEELIYAALSRLKAASVEMLAKECNLNRVSTGQAIKRLVGHGRVEAGRARFGGKLVPAYRLKVPHGKG
jgi:hypothetical protein